MLTFAQLLLVAGVVSASAIHPAHYQYRRANTAEGDVRSPCPALNTLANHGILPRNGRNLTAEMMATAIENTYNIDTTFGYVLAHASIPLVAESALTSYTINLDDLNLHDAIEHDASLTREDAISGDNHSIQQQLVQAMLDDVKGDVLTTESIARTRARREKESLLKGSPKLGFKQYTLAYGEPAIFLQAFGKQVNGTEWQVKKTDAKVWFGEERLPEGYVKPAKAISISDTGTLSNAIGSIAQKVIAASVKSTAPGRGQAVVRKSKMAETVEEWSA